MLGTVGYMSPEQVRGEPADARSDVFSFGAVLYEMLTGRPAFKEQSTAETMHAILRDEPPNLVEAQEPSPALDRIVRQCLEKAPHQRFQSARDVAFNLESVSTLSRRARGCARRRAEGRTPARQRRALLAAAAVAVVVARLGAREDAPAEAPVISSADLRSRLQSDPARFTRDGQTVVYSAAWHGTPARTVHYAAREPRVAAARARARGAGGCLVSRRAAAWRAGYGLDLRDDAGPGAPRRRRPTCHGRQHKFRGLVLGRLRIWRSFELLITNGASSFPSARWLGATNYLSHLRVSPQGRAGGVNQGHPPASGSSVGWLIMGRPDWREALANHEAGRTSGESPGALTVARSGSRRPDRARVQIAASRDARRTGAHRDANARTDGPAGHLQGRSSARLASRLPRRSSMAREPGASSERSLTWLGQSIVNDSVLERRSRALQRGVALVGLG